MKKSTRELGLLLDGLGQTAQALAMTDTAWALRAGIRKETLSRLRSRSSCDFATLQALARAVGSMIAVTNGPIRKTTADGRFPANLDRRYEEQLLALCASHELKQEQWQVLGPTFFMAGLAVMLASVADFDRRSLLALAEHLHAGSTQVGVFALWLEGSPVRPSRFLPMLSTTKRHAP